MKKKTAAYLAIGVVGIALALAAKFLLQGFLSNAQSGAMVGVGAGLFGYGVGKWCVALWGEKHPDLMKQSSKAQAISGEILHWLLIAGAWLGIFLDAPFWLTLLLVGVFLLKTILDFALIAYYQKRM